MLVVDVDEIVFEIVEVVFIIIFAGMVDVEFVMLFAGIVDVVFVVVELLTTDPPPTIVVELVELTLVELGFVLLLVIVVELVDKLESMLVVMLAVVVF